MKARLILATAALLLASSPSFAADRSVRELTVPTSHGDEVRLVTNDYQDGDLGVNPCGKELQYGGMAPDGARTLNCDGTGTYVDGSNTGDLVWGYAVSDDKTSLIVKTFNDWGVAMLPTDGQAAQVYIVFTSGPMAGQGFTEVLGANSGQVAMSPYYIEPQ